MTDTLTPEKTEEIADALASGQKIEAIKIYRAATGKHLVEAKEFIDALVPRLIEQDPEKYKALASKGSGCAYVLLACFSIGVATTVLVRFTGG